jgi:large conductance mechanosensitive channel protein
MSKKQKFAGIAKEFRDFAMRGNVFDLAVGVIIGGAFGKITASLVGDILTPIIGMFLGGADLSSLKLKLPDLYHTGEKNYLMYGSLIGTVIDFLIIALVVFAMVKTMNKLKEIQDKKKLATIQEEKAKAEPSAEIVLLTEIRDLLKDKSV